jgi:hypothetical protein
MRDHYHRLEGGDPLVVLELLAAVILLRPIARHFHEDTRVRDVGLLVRIAFP